jgi:hypothetical protein
MKKLTLQIEKLRVEQFETQPDAPETVQSFMTEDHSCGGITWGDGGRCICLDMPSSIC